MGYSFLGQKTSVQESLGGGGRMGVHTVSRFSPSFTPSRPLCLSPALSYHCETCDLNMAREVSSSHSIFKLLCLLFVDSCDVDEPEPESFSWESRMLHHPLAWVVHAFGLG